MGNQRTNPYVGFVGLIKFPTLDHFIQILKIDNQLELVSFWVDS